MRFQKYQQVYNTYVPIKIQFLFITLYKYVRIMLSLLINVYLDLNKLAKYFLPPFSTT